MDRRLVCCFLGAALLAVASATTYPPRDSGGNTRDSTTAEPPPSGGQQDDKGTWNNYMWNDTMWNDTMWNDTMGNYTMGNYTMWNETSPPPPPPPNGDTQYPPRGEGEQHPTTAAGDKSGGEQPPPTTAPGDRTGGEQPPPGGEQPAPTTAPGDKTGGEQPAPTTAPGDKTGGEQPAPTTAPGDKTGGEQPPPTTAGKEENPPTTMPGPGPQPGEPTMASGSLTDEQLRLQTLLQRMLPALNTSDLLRLRQMSTMLSYMPEDHKNTLRNVTSAQVMVSPDKLAFLSQSPEVLSFLKTTTLRQMNSTLSVEHKRPICKAAAAVPEIFRKVAPYLTCGPVLAEEKLDPVVERQLADTILNKAEGANSLSPEDWKQLGSMYPEAIRPADLDSMPDDFASQNLGTMAKILEENEDPAVQDTLLKKVRAAVRPSDMTSDQVKALVPSISAFPPSDIGAMPDAALKESLPDLAEKRGNLSPAQRTRIAEKVMKALPQDKTSWSAEQLVSLTKMKASNTTYLKTLTNDDVTKILSSPTFSASRDMDETEARMLRKQVDKLPDFQNKSAFTKERLQKFAPVLPGVQPSTVDQMNAVVLKESVMDGVFSNVSMPKDAAQVLSRKLESEYSASEPPQDLVAKLGDNVKGMTSGLASRLPEAALSQPENLAVLARTAPDLSRSTQQALISKLPVSSTNLCKLGKMGRYLTPDKASSLTGQDIVTAFSQEQSCDVELHDSQSSELFEKLTMQVGRPTGDNFNYTSSMLGKMGSSLMRGMTMEDWSSVSADSRLPDFLRPLSSQQHIDPAVAKKMVEKMSSYYNLASTPTATEDDLQTIGGGLLQHLDEASLQRLGRDKCLRVLSLIGARKDLDQDVEKLGKIAVNFGLNFCLGKASGGITSSEVRKMGRLLCFLDEAAVGRLDKGAMEVGSDILQACSTFSRKTRKALKSRVLATLEKSSVSEIRSSEDLAAFGTLLAVDCDSDFSSIPQEVRADAMPYVVEKMEKQRKMRMERDMVGRQQEVSSKERQKNNEDDKCAIRSMLAARVTAQGRRRRRSTAAPTCDEIKMMGSLASSLTTDQLSALAEQDFRDCALFLGQVSDWSAEQKQALASKAKAVWGVLSSWTPTHVESAGTMAQGLTSSELGQLTLHNDGMSALGQFVGWSLEQLEAGWARWFASQKSSTHNQVTGSDLIILGEFACGPSVSDIASLPTQAFGVAASSLGELRSCPHAKLEAFAAKAKAHYGNNVAQWSQGAVDALGIIMAALSGSDLSSLTQNQLSRLTPTTIAAIPADKFVSITPAQVRLLSSVQVQAVTPAQYSAATPALQQALRESGFTASVGDNGAGVTRLSGLLTLFTLLMLAL